MRKEGRYIYMEPEMIDRISKLAKLSDRSFSYTTCMMIEDAFSATDRIKRVTITSHQEDSPA